MFRITTYDERSDVTEGRLRKMKHGCTLTLVYWVLAMSLLAMSSQAQEDKKTAQLEPGEVRTFDGIEFVWIPPGKFLMGSPSSESKRDSDEGPLHEVSITKGFWLGKTEVTQAQWKRVMSSNPSNAKAADWPVERGSWSEATSSDPSNFKGADRPVERVRWTEAMEFCRIFSLKTGQSYSLPTEAQWEYACRAGTTTAYSFGDDPSSLQDYGWYEGNSGKQTHPVAQKLPNPWGLYDMHGNVWEWCQERYGKDYDATRSSSAIFRVLRGGSWSYGARLCRSANRDHEAPLARNAFDGFRLVRHSETNMVETYPGPDGVAPSDQYAVNVEQSGKQHDSFVYLSNSQYRTNRSETTSWTTFSFSGPVTVTVTKLQGGTVGTCKIIPSSYKIEPRIEGNSVTFELDRPRKVSVEFDGDTTHPMLVFADSLETGVPDANDPNVIYFGPGVHEIGDTFIDSGKTVYLAGGAYVRGRLRGNNVQDVTIRGRGVLSGEDYPHGSTEEANLINFKGRQNKKILIEGLTLVNSPLYLISARGFHNMVRNVKMFGWYFGTDGVYLGGDSLVEDCFLKVNDDAFKVYASNTVIRDCVIWQLENGAPFQISWNMMSDNSGFLVKNIDIIRMEHEWDGINIAVFDAVHGGRGHMSNYVFEDIRIENADWRLFHITLDQHQFADSTKGMGQISDLTFRNITATGPFKLKSNIRGWDADHKVYNVTFENLKINGKYIRNAEEGNFDIDPETTHNIVFKVDDEANTTETQIPE
jgi:formylglycine-generating enzyme required for sulfatase activity